MSERIFFNGFIALWFVLALTVFRTLLSAPAPYGRYTEKTAGRSIPSKWGWMLMESPTVFVFGATFLVGNYNHTTTAVVFLMMWMAHYVQRTFIYPFLLRSEKRMPAQIIVPALIFNSANGYINGRYLFEFSGGYSDGWLTDLRFLLGASLFVIGYVVNRHADWILHNLRRPGESGYEIPRGGLFRWISCPNYLGEMLIWVGWAVATWSWPALAFAVWTIANLLPRSWSHHKWYRARFGDYPPGRKALLPGVW